MNHETDVSRCPPASNDDGNLEAAADADAEARSGQLPSGIVVQREEFQISISSIPTAEELGKYENVEAGTANRILDMADNQAKHRQRIEWEETRSNIELTRSNIELNKRHQWFGFIFAIITLGAGVFPVYIGALVWGAVAISPWLLQLIEYFWDKFRHWQTRRDEAGRVSRLDPPQKPDNAT